MANKTEMGLIAALAGVLAISGGIEGKRAFDGYVAEQRADAASTAAYEAGVRGEREGYRKAVCAADATGRLGVEATQNVDLATTGAFSSDAMLATVELDRALAECPRSVN